MQAEGALDLFGVLQKQWLMLDVVLCSASISACEKGVRPERAWELFEVLQKQWLQPGIITYNAYIFAAHPTRC